MPGIAQVVILLILALTSGARAGYEALTIDDVKVGFQGYFTVGCWTPLTVTFTADEPKAMIAVVEVVDPEGNLTRFQSEPATVLEDGRGAISVLFCAGRLDSGIRVLLSEVSNGGDGPFAATKELLASEDDSGDFHPALRQTAKLYLTLGHPAGVDDVSKRSDKSSRGGADVAAVQRVVVSLEDPRDLPAMARAYDGVDTVIVAGSQDIEESLVLALREWVELGGRLVLSVGSDVSESQTTTLGKWLAELAEVRTAYVGDLSGLEVFAGSRESIQFSGRVRSVIPVPKHGKVLASTLAGPILVRVAQGFGQVTIFGLELNAPPLSTWAGVGSLCRTLLSDRDTDVGPDNRRDRQQLSHSGINDLATQLYSIQDQFPEIRRRSSWFVMGMMLLYLGLVGPADYLLVHRVLKRPELTWLTMPLIVFFGVALLIGLATSCNGDQMRTNQLDLVDVDEADQLVRVNSWMTVYSPEHRRYRFAVRPLDPEWPHERAKDYALAQNNTTSQTNAPVARWNGVPEQTFGGMYRPAGFEIGRPTYQFDPGSSVIDDLPVPIWSTRNLVANWHRRGASFVHSELRSTGASQLTGTLSHSLPVAIEDWIVAYGNRVFRPIVESDASSSARLQPHRILNLNGPEVYQRELRGFLTRTQATKVRRKDVNMPDIMVAQAEYDPLDRDPADLLRMVTFHDVAGGSSYTGLTNQSLDRLDFSPLLTLDRAVLFGRMEAPAAQLNLDDEPTNATRQWTFVRLVMPVERKDVLRRELPKYAD